jgi:ribonuclease Z
VAELVILGSSYAIPDEAHANAHMVLVGHERLVLIDCVNDELLRLKKAGLKYQYLSDIVITHFHPDHVSGIPTLLMNLWLLGRDEPLSIYGLDYTIDRLVGMMELFDWDAWQNLYPIALYRVPDEEGRAMVLDSDEFRIYGSPVRHLIPTMGLRIEVRRSGKVVAYSSDTQACQEVINLADGADILIHEATGAHPGHTTAYQAGEIAQQAGARTLYLIHYPTGEFETGGLVHQAKEMYQGPVALAEDLMRISLE